MKRLSNIAISLLCVSLFINACAAQPSSPTIPLTAEQMLTLRGEYPFVGEAALVSRIIPTFKQLIEETMDFYVVAQVVEIPAPYALEMQTSEETAEYALNEKYLKEFGESLIDTELFTQYRIRVEEIFLQNSAQNLAPGDEICIMHNALFDGAMPKFEKGDRFVTMIGYGLEGTRHEGNVFFGAENTYYIVDGDYVLSASPVEEYEKLSGLPLKDFIETIKNIQEQP